MGDIDFSYNYDYGNEPDFGFDSFLNGDSSSLEVPQFDYGAGSAEPSYNLGFNLDNALSPESTPSSDSGFGLKDFADLLKPAVGGLISAGPGIFSAVNQNAALKQSAEDKKFQALLELAKLKYGPKGGGGRGGGGGGSALARQQLRIQTLLQGQAAKSAALTSLQEAFNSIYRG